MRDIKILFRYDDFSSISSTEAERAIIDAFTSNGFSCIFGVVPFAIQSIDQDVAEECLPLPEEKITIINRAIKDGVVETALHGYHHRKLLSAVDGKPTEFAGLPCTEQFEKIREGKAALEQWTGGNIRIFIPPFNTYDANTVKALESTGFACLSAGMFDYRPNSSSLSFLPHTCNLLQLKGAVENLRDKGVNSAIIMVLFHQYDFVERNDYRRCY